MTPVSQILFYDDVTVGDRGPELTHTLTRGDLVVYAGASGDFNPMHTDEVAAQEAGLPSVFGHGMFSAGLVATALTNWIGIGNLTNFKVRFAKQTWPGEVLTTSITVAAMRVDDGVGLVELECSLSNAEGQEKVVGSATAKLPRRP
jgi:acyl dehydratase